MSITNEIATYQLIHFSKRRKDSDPIAQISLHNADNRFLGYVYFYRDNQELRDSYSVEDTTPKRAFLRMHESQLDEVIDMLRNEKPCHLYYGSPTYGYLYTGAEPIGEEESDE